MEKNKKQKTAAKSKSKIISVKKPKKALTKNNIIKKNKTAKCCPIFAGKKKYAIKILIILIIIALIIGLFFLVKSFKKDSTKIDTKRPLDMNTSQQIETGEVVETYLLDEELPPEPEVITQGRFNDVEQNLEGKALFMKSSDGENYLRFEKFKTINGQDLHVYLSPILTLDTGDAIDLGLLKSVSGNFNYKIEKDIDIEKYNNVIIWSNPFNAFFGYASLISKELDPEPETEMTEESDQQESEEISEEPTELPNENEESEQIGTEEESEEDIDEEESEIQESTEEINTEEPTENEKINTEETEEETTETSSEENTENQ